MSVRITPRRVIWTIVIALVLGLFGVMAYSILDVFRPKDVSKMEPQRLFRWLVCNPVPSSVTNLKASGTIMFTGHLVFMEFAIAPADFEPLLKTGKFQQVEQVYFKSRWSPMNGEPTTAREYYEKRDGEFGGDLRTVFMLATTNHNQVFIQYFRP